MGLKFPGPEVDRRVDRWALLYFGPIFIGFLFLFILSWLIDDGVCLFGGEWISNSTYDNTAGWWSCEPIPNGLKFFPFFWFFLGTPFGLYIYNWRYDQYNT